MCFSISPGPVDTDMGESFQWARWLFLADFIDVTATFAVGNDEAMKAVPLMTVEKSTNAVMAVIDDSTRQKDGGLFLGWDGKVRNF